MRLSGQSAFNCINGQVFEPRESYVLMALRKILRGNLFELVAVCVVDSNQMALLTSVALLFA